MLRHCNCSRTRQRTRRVTLTLLNVVDKLNAKLTLVNLPIQMVPKARAESAEVNFLNAFKNTQVDFEPVAYRNTKRINVKVLLAV